MIDLDELMRKHNAATPGPWEHKIDDAFTAIHTIEPSVASYVSPADAAYICAACNAVPELVSELKSLREKAYGAYHRGIEKGREQGIELRQSDLEAKITQLAYKLEKERATSNKLSRTLRWTGEPPTEPGWYFFRGNIPGYHENNPPVYVDVHKNKVVFVRRASWVLSNLIIKYDIEWAGPIQEPVE